VHCLAWTRDGTRLVASRYDGLWLVAADGSEMKQLVAANPTDPAPPGCPVAI
jgi:hypothetical protein